MTDYQLGLMAGGFIGCVLAFATMIFVWSLCNIAHRSNNDTLRINNWENKKTMGDFNQFHQRIEMDTCSKYLPNFTMMIIIHVQEHRLISDCV